MGVRREEGKKETIRLRILPDGSLQVSAPAGLDVIPVLEREKQWIDRKVREIESVLEENRGTEDLLLLHGHHYWLTQGSSCSISEDTVTYTTPGELKETLTDLLLHELRAKITRFAPKVGRRAGKICVRTQKTRWGSCSGRDTLNFNLMMLALPERLRDYIILHEIVHLVERNHAPAFWDRLVTLCPDCEERRKELKKFWILLERNSIWRVLRE